MDNTYIKLFRRITDWEWYGDANTMRVFIHILLNANIKPKRFEGVEIKPGQCVFGRKTWAKELGLTERQVRTALEHLKSTNEVTAKSTNKFTIITVEKWDFWQVEDGLSDQQNDQQEVKRTTTPKESKNISTTIYKRPTLDEIKIYAEEKGLIVDTDFFFNYFEANHWIDSKGKEVKNWKQKLLTWNKKEVENGNNRTNTPRSRSGKNEYGLHTRSNNRKDGREDGEADYIQRYAEEIEKRFNEPNPF